MQTYKTTFFKLALQHEVLRFGSFTLKSGRVSPYFFNLGRIASGGAMREQAFAWTFASRPIGDCHCGSSVNFVRRSTDWPLG